MRKPARKSDRCQVVVSGPFAIRVGHENSEGDSRMAQNPPVAVVTGASSGIGRATALALAAANYRVVAVARSKDKLTELAALSPSISIEAVDAADGAAVVAMAQRVLKDFGTPAVIINCAGAGQWKYIEDTTPAEALTMLGAPFLAAFNVTHAFMRSMLAAKAGVVIHVQSPASQLPWAGSTAYASARYALRGLHEALCQDLIGTGVRSCHAVFGEVTSDYFTNNPGSHEHLPKIARMIPKMSPEQCATVLVRLSSHPRTQVVTPFMLRSFYWMHAVVPWLVRMLVGATGRKHLLTP